MNTKTHGIKLYVILIFFPILVIACSKTPMERLQSEIEFHGKIDAVDNENVFIQRLNIDSLDKRSTQLLNEYINFYIPSYPAEHQYVIINYYPGVDDNNSTGSATRNRIGRKNAAFNKKIDKRSNATQLNIFKNSKGLNRFNKNKKYYNDKDLFLTSLFFKEHYPGSSYVIVHQSGKHLYYYGEHMIEAQIEHLDLFTELISKGYL